MLFKKVGDPTNILENSARLEFTCQPIFICCCCDKTHLFWFHTDLLVTVLIGADPDWNDLPHDLLDKVAQCLGDGRMKAVSKSWKAACKASAAHVCIRSSSLPLNLSTRFPSLTSLDLQECTAITPEALRALPGQLQLVSLRMSLDDITDVLGEPLHELTQLSSLDLHREVWSDELTDARIERLRGLPLTQLDLTYCKVTPVGLSYLAGMPLSSLTLCCSYYRDSYEPLVTARDLEVLRGMPLTKLHLGSFSDPDYATLELLRTFPLTDLNLGFNGHQGDLFWTDAALKSLLELPLTSLNLGHRNNFSHLNLQLLQGMPLKRLCLGSTIPGNLLPEDTLSFVREMSSLSSLGLGDFHQITDEHLASIWGMQLTGLDLGPFGGRGMMSVNGLGALLGMPLQSLSLCGEDFTDEGLEYLLGVPMTSLALYGASITDAGMSLLSGFSLTSLDVRCTKITDAGLPFILGMPLRELCLDETEITFEGLKVLKDLPLEVLNVPFTEESVLQKMAQIWELIWPEECIYRRPRVGFF